MVCQLGNALPSPRPSPVLPFLYVVLNYVELRALHFCLKRFCRHATKPFEAKDKNSTLWFLFATFCICMFTCAKFLYDPPRASDYFCGPFSLANGRRYLAIPNFITKESPLWFNKILEYAVNPMLIYSLVIFLCVVVLFSSTRLHAVRNQCVENLWQLRTLTRNVQELAKTKKISQDREQRKKAQEEEYLEKVQSERDKYRQRRDELKAELKKLKRE